MARRAYIRLNLLLISMLFLPVLPTSEPKFSSAHFNS